MSLRTSHPKPNDPEIITISDDESEAPPIISPPKAPPVKNIILTTPAHTPGSLSLSCRKTIVKNDQSPPPHAPDLLSPSMPQVKNEIQASPITLQIHSSKNGTALLVSKSPDCKDKSNPTTAIISITTPDPPKLPKEQSPQAKKLLDIINKVNMRKEIHQSKFNATIQLPIPKTGSLTTYQAPENEVHSSTGTSDAKNPSIIRFFETCRKLSRDKGDGTIVERIWKRVDKWNSSYTNSKEFLNFTRTVHLKLINDPSNLHVYLKEFYDGLEEFRSSYNAKKQTAETDKGECSGPSTSHNTSGCNEPDTTSQEAPIDRRILYLEDLLKKCSKKIKKYEEREMSLDDLDDEESTYLIIDKYKKRSLDIWRRLNNLTGQKHMMGRVIEKKFSYEGSRYPEINKAISNHVNKTKDFPDFSEVVDVITTCSEQFDLHLRPTLIENIATEAFKDIGKELKKRRILDYEEHYGCPEFDMVQLDNDPAYRDESLQATLMENKKLAMKKTDEVFEEYVLKQADLDIKGGGNGSEDEPPDDESSEDQSQNEESDANEDAEKKVPVDASGVGVESDSASEYKEDETEDNIDDNDDGDVEDSLDIEYEDSIDIEYENEAEDEDDDHLWAKIEEAIEENVADLQDDGQLPLSTFDGTGIPEEDDGPKFTPSENNRTISKRHASSDLENQPPSKRYVELTEPVDIGVKVETILKVDDNPLQDNSQEEDDSSDPEIVILD